MTEPSATLLGMTEPQAADMLGVHADTLRAWRKKGAIGYSILPGGRIRYQPEHLHQFLKSTRVEPKLG